MAECPAVPLRSHSVLSSRQLYHQIVQPCSHHRCQAVGRGHQLSSWPHLGLQDRQHKQCRGKPSARPHFLLRSPLKKEVCLCSSQTALPMLPSVASTSLLALPLMYEPGIAVHLTGWSTALILIHINAELQACCRRHSWRSQSTPKPTMTRTTSLWWYGPALSCLCWHQPVLEAADSLSAELQLSFPAAEAFMGVKCSLVLCRHLVFVCSCQPLCLSAHASQGVHGFGWLLQMQTHCSDQVVVVC